jgi:hypothetical protein
MRKRFLPPLIVVAVWMFSPFITARPQTAPPAKSGPPGQKAAPVDPEELQVHIDGWNRPIPKLDKGQTSAPASIHDISGTWEPANGWRNGRQATGSYNYPSDGKHVLPFTPEGEKAWRANKPVTGTTGVPEALVNDPFELCDPIGFPRVELHDLSAVQIVQTPKKLLLVFENDQVWRNIWTDGRDFSKITEPRWYGYSVGKWVDDSTLLVETIGLDERTWLDNAGRPHTKDLRVEERFHRVNHDILELTVTIIDPTYYSKPWNALDKYPMRLQSDSFDIRENVCSASEAAEYKKEVGEEAIEKK